MVGLRSGQRVLRFLMGSLSTVGVTAAGERGCPVISAVVSLCLLLTICEARAATLFSFHASMGGSQPGFMNSITYPVTYLNYHSQGLFIDRQFSTSDTGQTVTITLSFGSSPPPPSIKAGSVITSLTSPGARIAILASICMATASLATACAKIR